MTIRHVLRLLPILMLLAACAPAPRPAASTSAPVSVSVRATATDDTQPTATPFVPSTAETLPATSAPVTARPTASPTATTETGPPAPTPPPEEPTAIATAAPTAAPGPPSPDTEPAGSFRLDVGSGPAAGVYEVESTQVRCTSGSPSEDGWSNRYTAPDRGSRLRDLSLQVGAVDETRRAETYTFTARFAPGSGNDQPEVLSIVDDAARTSGNGTVTVSDADGRARFTLSGHTAEGVDIELTYVCGRVDPP